MIIHWNRKILSFMRKKKMNESIQWTEKQSERQFSGNQLIEKLIE